MHRPRTPLGVRTAPVGHCNDDVRVAAGRRGAQHLPLRVVQVGTEAAPQEPKLSAGAQRIHPARPASSGARASRPPPGLGIIEGLRGVAAARVPRSADSGVLARALARSGSLRHAPKYLGHAPSLQLAGHVNESPETTSSAPLPIPGFGAAWGHRAGACGGVSGGNSTLFRSMSAKQTSRGRCSRSEHSPPASFARHARGSTSDAARDREGCGAPEPSLHSSTAEARVKAAAKAGAEGGGGEGGCGRGEGLIAGGTGARIVDVRFSPVHLDKVLRQERPPARLQVLMLQGNGLRQLPASLGSFVGLYKLAVTWNELRYGNNSFALRPCNRALLLHIASLLTLVRTSARSLWRWGRS
jgi:hypothetical protein